MQDQYDNVIDNNEQQDPNTYQVMVANIAWKKESNRQFRSKYDAKKELPDQMAFDIPIDRITKFQKHPSTFNDEIESYIYNTLTGKFGHEVLHCQIYLPLDK